MSRLAAPCPLTLGWLNAVHADDAASALDGLYEHSPWIVETAIRQRPAGGWAQLAGFKYTLVHVLAEADRDEQIALVRAHPELAGKAALAGELTPESTGEQARAGLNQCTPEESPGCSGSMRPTTNASAALRDGGARPARPRPAPARDPRHLRAAPGRPPGLRTGRMPAATSIASPRSA